MFRQFWWKGHEVTYRTRAALAVAAVAGPVVLFAAPAARAAVVDVNYRCATPIGVKSAVSPVGITAEKSGSGYRITMSFEKGVSSSPIELGKGAMNPSARLIVGGAGSGQVAVKGVPNPQAVPANSPITIGRLTGTWTPTKSGKVTFTAGELTITALGTKTLCKPTNNPGPALELDVTAAGGGGEQDSASGGAAAGGGELPRTGPLDSAAALATLGGTVVLSGAAGVLWLTRRGARRPAA
ncbi:peptidase [Streptomyces sp. NPDC094448]|uniref:peptidase n=1 Tax=Streptomyces sp. NPDC094448 TaxID=3366063 RepID=UPI0038133EA4